MTPQQKANEIAENNLKWYYEEGNSYEECYQSALKAMQWKDEQYAKEKQQWIEKVCEWLEENAYKFVCTKPYPYNVTTTNISPLYCGYATKALIDNLKKVMEE